MRKPDESDCFVIDGSVDLNVNDSLPLTPDSSALMDANHLLEVEVSRRLKSQPDIELNDLVVRRCRDGICVEGVVFNRADIGSIKEILRDLLPLGEIHNRLTVHKKEVHDNLAAVQWTEQEIAEIPAPLPLSPPAAKATPYSGMNVLNRFFGKK